MSWRVARALDKLLAQINAYAPNRSKISDGSIGDTAHSSRVSDHNPDSRGIVHARDFTHSPATGFDAHAFVRRLAKAGDRRIKYLISNRQISNPSISGGRWRPYSGSNAHTQHAHVSCVYGALEDNTAAWPGLAGTSNAGGTSGAGGTSTGGSSSTGKGKNMITKKTSTGGQKTVPVSRAGYKQLNRGDGDYTILTVGSGVIDIDSTFRVRNLPAGAEVQIRYIMIEYHNWKKSTAILRNGSRGAEVGKLQRFLGIKDDEIFGAGTEKKVRALQSKKGIKVDGEVGSGTRAVLPTNRRITTYGAQVQEIIGTGGDTFGTTHLRAWPGTKSGQSRRIRIEAQTFHP
ncbi:peptidoglycan-binding domain-containing protein, partial [Brevibacterium sediminis]